MTEIRKRQNEKSALILQCFARYNYNMAEIFNFAVWCLSIISILIVTVPQSAPKIIIIGLPFSIDLAIVILECFFSKTISIGANSKAIFDNYVFGFNDSLDMNQSFKEQILKFENNHKEWISVQKSNTAQDTPPGVREWYNTNSEKTGLDAVFMCQKENRWWAKKLFPFKILIMVSLVILCVILFSIMIHYDYICLWEVIFSFPLLYKLIERTCVNLKCIYIGTKVNGKIETLEVSKNKKQILELQSTINELRSLKITGINYAHKIKAHILSYIYDKTKE